MSVARLNEELAKIKSVVQDDKVRMWVTPQGESIIQPDTEVELLSVMRDAYTKTHQIGNQSVPFLMAHDESPELRFVGMRLRGEPYYFVVHGAGESEWLRFMTDAYLDNNRH